MKVRVSDKYLKGHRRKTKELRKLLDGAPDKPHTKRVRKYLDTMLERHDVAAQDRVLDFEE